MLVAGLLDIFLGGVGAYRLYLKRNGIGLLQIALFILLSLVTFGFIGLWGAVEGILILCGAPNFRKDAEGIPLRT